MIHKSINIKGRLLNFDEAKVMSIINITPDSFYADSRFRLQTNDTPDILDIGACSTRPGSEAASEDEEIERINQYVPEILKHYGNLPLSIDTFRTSVARLAIEQYGFDIINDVSGGCDEMFELCADKHVAYVLCWPYGGSTADMMRFFSEKTDKLARMGVADIILDPAFGFGKTFEQNYEIARNMSALGVFNLPVLVGISRKSMLQKLLNISAAEALNSTTALNCMLLERGADILRVHDTREAREAIKIVQQFS